MLVNAFEKKSSSANHAISWIMSRLNYEKIAKVVKYADDYPHSEHKVVLFEYLQPNAAYIRKNGSSAAIHFLPDGTSVDSAVRTNYEVRDFLDKMFRTPNTEWYVRYNHICGDPEAASCQVVLRFLEKLPPLETWTSYCSPINSSHC
jgi:hypothetical protein